MSQKECRWCGVTKPLDEFVIDKRKATGRAGHCKACNRRRWDKKYREAYRARNRDAERARLRKREKELRHTPKAVARRTLAYAVRAGTVVKPPACESCGQPKPRQMLHGHHHDYTKPLDVKWLCQPCHAAEHTSARTVAERAMGRPKAGPVAEVQLTFSGETRTLSEWARHLGLLPTTIWNRRGRGWPVERVLSPLERRPRR